MPSLRVTINNTDSGTVDERLLVRSPVRLGRSDLNDLMIDSGYVSRWHSLIRFDHARVEYLDLGSTNGTVLNGKRLRAACPVVIRPDDAVTIGTLRLKIELSVEEAPAAPAAGDDMSGHTIADPEQGKRFRQVVSAVDSLQPIYASCTTAAQKLVERLQQMLVHVPAEAQPLILNLLEQRCPEIRANPDYIKFKVRSGFLEQGKVETKPRPR
jgi:hypothetical protein